MELPRSFELELTRCGEASVFNADSDIDMLCIVSSAGVTSDVPAFSCDRHDTDHGRALVLLRFLRSCTWLVNVSYDTASDGLVLVRICVYRGLISELIDIDVDVDVLYRQQNKVLLNLS